MKKFIIRLTLFLLPAILWVFMNIFFIPIDLVYFRSWEAMAPKLFFSYYTGPFYPSMVLEKNEKGDLAPHTDFAISKPVVWRTDRYGYRTDSAEEKHNIVVIGDSNVAGSSLTQDDIFSEILGETLGENVYPYAPHSIEDSVKAFLGEKRFMGSKPEVVVLSSIERNLIDLNLDAVGEITPINNFKLTFFERLKSSNLLTAGVTILDRSFNPTVLKYFVWKIMGKVPEPLYGYESDGILFLKGWVGDDKNLDNRVYTVADVIEYYDDLFKKIGIHMIFLPIPDKENIYYKMFPQQKKTEFLAKLVNELGVRNIDVIDLQSKFETAYKMGIELYQNDDTHWNAQGVRVASDSTAKRIEDYRLSR